MAGPDFLEYVGVEGGEGGVVEAEEGAEGERGEGAGNRLPPRHKEQIGACEAQCGPGAPHQSPVSHPRICNAIIALASSVTRPSPNRRAGTRGRPSRGRGGEAHPESCWQGRS